MNKISNTEYFAMYDFPVGIYKICYTDSAITRIEYIGQKTEKTAHFDGTTSALSQLAQLQLQEYFAGTRHIFTLPLKMHGTVFQKKVWAALCDIPYGKTCSYKEIACAIGNQKASRAVGMANNKNPMSIVVPCHRVIGASGSLVGYASGLHIKSALLDLEKKYL